MIELCIMLFQGQGILWWQHTHTVTHTDTTASPDNTLFLAHHYSLAKSRLITGFPLAFVHRHCFMHQNEQKEGQEEMSNSCHCNRNNQSPVRTTTSERHDRIGKTAAFLWTEQHTGTDSPTNDKSSITAEKAISRRNLMTKKG
jgi:hypothetical protein